MTLPNTGHGPRAQDVVRQTGRVQRVAPTEQASVIYIGPFIGLPIKVLTNRERLAGLAPVLRHPYMHKNILTRIIRGAIGLLMLESMQAIPFSTPNFVHSIKGLNPPLKVPRLASSLGHFEWCHEDLNGIGRIRAA